MGDFEKVKFLEENLKAIPNCVSNAISSCLGTLTNIAYNIDANGNISIAISGSSAPDGKIARANAKREAQEKVESEEKAAKKRSEKKAVKEKAAERRTEIKAADKPQSYNITAAGASVEEIIQHFAKNPMFSIAEISSASGLSSVDVRT